MEKQQMMNKKKFAAWIGAGSLAALLAFGALAPQVSFAQDTPTTTPTQQSAVAGDWGARVAEQLGVTEAELQSAIDAVAEQIVTDAVAAEALTADEGDAILASLATVVADGAQGGQLRDLMQAARAIDFDMQTALADELGVDASELGIGFMADGRGGMGRGDMGRGDMGRGGMGRGGMGRGDMGPGGFNALSEEEQAAMTARHEAMEALLPYLEAETYQNAITSARQAAIDEAVADGALTDEQAAALAEAGVGPHFGFGGHGGRHGMGGGYGFGPDAPDSTPDATEEDEG
jgi:hypothetical protein